MCTRRNLRTQIWNGTLLPEGSTTSIVCVQGAAGAEVPAEDDIFDGCDDARGALELGHRKHRHAAVGNRVKDRLIGVENRPAGQILGYLHALANREVVRVHHHADSPGRSGSCGGRAGVVSVTHVPFGKHCVWTCGGVAGTFCVIWA